MNDKLVQLRKKNGLSQLELAEKLNVSRQAISKWEIGTTVPSVDNIKKLSKLYDIPLAYLMNDWDESLPEETIKVEVPQADNKYWRIPKHIAIIAVCLIVILCVFCASTIALYYAPQTENSDIIHIKDLDGEAVDWETIETDDFEILW